MRFSRYLWLALFIAAAGCKGSPTAPEPVTKPEPVAPLAQTGCPLLERHNIPATMPDGSVVWVCSTQLRPYTTPNGRVEWLYDHYVQRTPCPEVPIQ